MKALEIKNAIIEENTQMEKAQELSWMEGNDIVIQGHIDALHNLYEMEADLKS